jgi:hypothetical protein
VVNNVQDNMLMKMAEEGKDERAIL